MHLVASAPGVGKSVMAINWAIRAAVPTLYLAMDGDEMSMCIRVVQSAQLIDRSAAEDAIKENGHLAREVLDTIDWVRFDFPTSPDMDEVVHRTWAFAEIYGEYPHLIVVDNLMDVVGEEDRAAYSAAEKDLTNLARASRAAVLVLAHVTGQYEGSKDTIPLSGLMFKPSKKPSLVLSLNPGAFDHQLWASVLKNRDGPADPSGLRVRAELRVDYARMQMT